MKSLTEFINEATYHEYGTKEYFRDNYGSKYGPSRYREGMKTIRIPTGNKLEPSADVEIGCCKLNGFVLAKTKEFEFDKTLEGEWYEVSFMNKEKNKNIVAFVTPSSPWIIFLERFLQSWKFVGVDYEKEEENYELIDDPNNFDDSAEHYSQWTYTNYKAVYAEGFEYDDPKNLYKILSKEFEDICKNSEIFEDENEDIEVIRR